MADKGNKRRQQAEQTRSRIQMAALDLFDKHGFDNVSIDEIARAAGCSVGNIYHYFSNKEAITLHMTDFVDEKFAALAERYRSGAGAAMTAREALIDYCVEVLAINAGEELLYQCFIHSIRHPEAGVLRIDYNRPFFAVFRERIEAFLAEERLTAPAEEVLHDFVVMIRGVMIEWRIEEGGFDLTAKGRRMATLLTDGYRAR
ncbi:MAG: TetR/AcrR family transcriptional regulator [Mogibacterium sp.]|nr:TetR/AcrR family transcriptional regulator [Mogibacterium sp.]